VLGFSADGKTVAAVHGPGFTSGVVFPIHLWDVESGKYLRSLRGHDTGTMSVAFSPDGSVIASGGIDNTLRFWHGKTGEALGLAITIPVHGYTVAFSPDGKRLALGTTGMQMYDVAERKLLPFKFADAERSAYYWEVAWSPDGKLVAGGTDGHIRIWNADSGAIVRTIQTSFHAHRSHFAFSADGKQVVVNGWPKRLLSRWDVATGKLLADEPAPKAKATPDGAVSPELLCLSRDGSRILWLEQTKPYDQSGRNVVVADGDGKEVRRIVVPSPLTPFRVSPDAKRLAAGGTDGSLRLWDTDTGKETRLLLDGASAVYHAAYSATGKVLRSLHADGSVREWDPDTGKETRRTRLALPAEEFMIATTADGRLLGTATRDGQFTLWDTTTGKARVRLDEKLFVREPPQPFGFPPGPPPGPPVPHTGPPDVSVRLGDDGKHIVGLTGKGETITVWDAATGKALHTLKAPEDVVSFTLAPDGNTLITGGARTVCWDLKKSTPTRTWDTSPAPNRPGLSHNGTRIAGLFLLPDAKTLAIVEEQFYALFPPPPGRPGFPAPGRHFAHVRLVSLDGKEKRDRFFPGGDANLVAFTPDGTFLAAVDATKLRLFNLSTSRGYEASLPPAHPGQDEPLSRLAVRPDGKQIGTASSDGTILLWDATKMRDVPMKENFGEK
jgi:WD40 repeat protein